jgi:hypothetical protein
MSKQSPENHTDLMWQMRMQMLMKRKKNMEIAQIIDDALYEYYSELGQDVPKWKQNKLQWWTEYLTNLGMDPRNP